MLKLSDKEKIDDKKNIQELKREIALKEAQKNLEELDYRINEELIVLTQFVAEREKWNQILKNLL